MLAGVAAVEGRRRTATSARVARRAGRAARRPSLRPGRATSVTAAFSLSAASRSSVSAHEAEPRQDESASCSASTIQRGCDCTTARWPTGSACGSGATSSTHASRSRSPTRRSTALANLRARLAADEACELHRLADRGVRRRAQEEQLHGAEPQRRRAPARRCRRAAGRCRPRGRRRGSRGGAACRRRGSWRRRRRGRAGRRRRARAARTRLA